MKYETEDANDTEDIIKVMEKTRDAAI